MIPEMSEHIFAMVFSTIVLLTMLSVIGMYTIKYYSTFRCTRCGHHEMHTIEAGVAVYCCGCGDQYTVEQIHEEMSNV